MRYVDMQANVQYVQYIRKYFRSQFFGQTTTMELETTGRDPETAHADAADEGHTMQTTPTQREIVRLLFNRTRRRSAMNVLPANGSARSIKDWGKKARLNKEQRQAFEIMTATFILTFFAKAPAPAETEITAQTVRHTFLSEKRRLERLGNVRKSGSDQLICLLSAPDGSAKPALVDLMMKYARDYCTYLEHFEFTSTTIVTTAMTGVGDAALLMATAPLSPVYLNQRQPIDAEQIQLWTATKLLIILDAVFFASKDDFINVRQLKECLNLPYEGLNIIIFADFRQLLAARPRCSILCKEGRLHQPPSAQAMP
jgi:hypothetical protein